jgi:hypothetical protein
MKQARRGWQRRALYFRIGEAPRGGDVLIGDLRFNAGVRSSASLYCLKLKRAMEEKAMKFSVLCSGLLVCWCLQVSASTLLDAADSTYARRGDRFDYETMLADSNIVNQAIDLYRRAAGETTGAAEEEALWKLLRAYWFKGSYTTADRETKAKRRD